MFLEFFDVFRIDHEPRGYADFASGYKGRVDTKVETGGAQYVGEHNIVDNRKVILDDEFEEY